MEYNKIFNDLLIKQLDIDVGQITSSPTFEDAWNRLFAIGLSSVSDLLIDAYHSEKIIDIITNISYRLYEPDLLLNALFQLSGVAMPCSLPHLLQLNDSNSAQIKDIRCGHKVAAHCLTELSGGTDIFNMQTCADKSENGWLLTGEKSYICNATKADVGLVYAKMSNAQSKYHSLNCFLVCLKKPNISISPPLEKLGLKNVAMGNIVFDGVSIEEDALVGKLGMGFNLLQISTTFERLVIPIAFIGRMIKIYTLCRKVTRNNASHSVLMGDMYIILFSALSVLRAILQRINLNLWDRSYLRLGCILKTKLSEAYLSMAKKGKEILDTSNEIKQEIDIKNELRSAMASWIYSGTNDVLKNMLIDLNI